MIARTAEQYTQRPGLMSIYAQDEQLCSVAELARYASLEVVSEKERLVQGNPLSTRHLRLSCCRATQQLCPLEQALS